MWAKEEECEQVRRGQGALDQITTTEGECECDSLMQDRREKFWGRLVIFFVEIKNGEWAVGWVFKGRFTGEVDELNENWWVILVNIPHFSHETGETN